MSWPADPVKRRECRRRLRQTPSGKAARRRERKNRLGRPADKVRRKRHKMTPAGRAGTRIQAFQSRTGVRLDPEERQKVRAVLIAIYTAASMACEYCGVALTSEARVIDHRVPLAAGGKTSATNLVCACRSCNSRKWKKMPNDFGMNRESLRRIAAMAGASQRDAIEWWNAMK